MDKPQPCSHRYITSTEQRGIHCAHCKVPLLSFTMPIPLNTPAGALLAAFVAATTKEPS